MPKRSVVSKSIVKDKAPAKKEKKTAPRLAPSARVDATKIRKKQATPPTSRPSKPKKQPKEEEEFEEIIEEAELDDGSEAGVASAASDEVCQQYF